MKKESIRLYWLLATLAFTVAVALDVTWPTVIGGSLVIRLLWIAGIRLNKTVPQDYDWENSV